MHIIVIQKNTGQRYVVHHAPSLRGAVRVQSHNTKKYKLCSFPLFVPIVTLRVNASKHPTETPLGRDESSAQLNNATPHNIPQKHTAKYIYLTYAWGPYISTGSAAELENNCECIKVIMFYPNTGNLYNDKPASCNNMDTVTPRRIQLGI